VSYKLEENKRKKLREDIEGVLGNFASNSRVVGFYSGGRSGFVDVYHG